MTQKPRLAYAAMTSTCTFFLDDEGICRRVDLEPGARGGRLARAAEGCVGTQYLASLDAEASGALVEFPRVGASMLFARVDGGRVSLVRTGIVTRFLRLSADAPAMREAESLDPFSQTDGVRTSAPPVLPRRLHLDALRLGASTVDLDEPTAGTLDFADTLDPADAPDGDDAPTQQIRAVTSDEEEDDDLLETAEYRSAPSLEDADAAEQPPASSGRQPRLAAPAAPVRQAR